MGATPVLLPKSDAALQCSSSEVRVALSTFGLCKLSNGCWRGDECRFRHDHKDEDFELARLRRVSSARFSASPSLVGAGEAAGGVPSVLAYSDLDLDSAEDDARMQEIEAMRCQGCGHYEFHGCSSDCVKGANISGPLPGLEATSEVFVDFDFAVMFRGAA